MKFHWWQTGVIYQVYPRSFQDSNGDGIGDLAGIAQRLDYLVSLGVDAVWLSPIYPSPMADFGYDISNYTDIDPVFGTLEEFDALLRGNQTARSEAAPGLRAQSHLGRASLVPRGASEPAEPQAGLVSLARPRVGGGPPNNWLSNFGGSAWEWDAPTQQYYYHSFLKEQPDLNWRNPEVVARDA